MALIDRRRLAAFAFVVAGAFLPTAAQAADVTISGSVFYRERMALPDDATLTVQLVDTTQAPVGVVGEASVHPAGQVPIAFSLSIDAARLAPGKDHGLMARIAVDGVTWFANETPAPIDLEEPAAPLSVLLVRVAEKSPPENPAEAGSIKGTAWRLSSLGGEDAAASVVSTLTFNDDNNISGNGGCNSFGGKASFDGVKLKFSDVFSTMMACEQPKMEQEAAFLAALAKAASYTVEGGTLTLRDGSGTAVATLTAEP
ncbi:META domain-containing protein [Allomesorhizobium camelthorni]|uniref:META domain-containing protein n=1 Tax=Allomesorhizobium camelthorni TaxID=475069 RepID=A0A6G4WBI4_9HYPH|nr:META domain-containing protein [Mesorhizobium camelthorni]NGO52155.1 META domain-containing protein [Mesorhizobium camelthorni]